METIHFKTVDPVSQELLRNAAGKSICLNWERYEKQQPQDGFLRLGLACPYGCMEGPCRIDPFGRGPQKGICGLDRDAMVAALLLRLTLQGALESAAGNPGSYAANFCWSEPLSQRAAAALKQTGGDSLSLAEVADSALLLCRPTASPEKLVRKAIRLGLLSVGLADSNESPSFAGDVSVGYGLLAGDAIRIAVTGRIPKETVDELASLAAGLSNPAALVVSLGDWIPCGDKFLPVVCTSGEAETVLTSGKVNILLAGDGTDRGILSLCANMNLPVSSAGKKAAASEILQKARDAFNHRSPGTFSPDAALIGKGRVSDAKDLENLWKGQAKIALLGGADTLRHSLGYLPVELAKALRGENHEVASWGDAALWMVKQDLPVGILAAQDGPLSAVRALAQTARLGALKGICFTGLKGARDFNLALGLSALGLKVAVSTPLPLWGSEKVRALLRENLAAAGGILTHFDHPVKADEILDWYLRA